MTSRHDAEVALRVAAIEYVAAMTDKPVDAKDSAFARINAKLMKAALQYAGAVGKRAKR